jgi:hypothetical protein
MIEKMTERMVVLVTPSFKRDYSKLILSSNPNINVSDYLRTNMERDCDKLCEKQISEQESKK